MTHSKPATRGRSDGAWLLLRGIHNTVRADADASRVAIFQSLLTTSRSARLAVRLHAFLGASWLSTLLVALYGLRAYLVTRVPASPQPLLLLIATHQNANRQVRRVASWFHDQPTVASRFDSRGLLGTGAVVRFATLLFQPKSATRALRVIHVANHRYGFLVGCRVASNIACYGAALSILRRVEPRAVVVSSDTNPEEIAFTAAAERLRITTIFVAHAFPSPYSPSLRFGLSLLEGDAALDARRLAGSVRGTVFLLGVEGDSAPLEPSRLTRSDPIIGVFVPKVVSWEKLAETIADCQERFGAREVLVRWHPSAQEQAPSSSAWRASRGVIETSSSEPLRNVVMRCDWVVADANSNVHLQVLKMGVPTVAVDGLSVSTTDRADIYGFCANRVVPPAARALRDLSVDSVLSFYSGDWPQRFVRYDAAYLRDPREVERLAQQAIEVAIRRRGEVD